MSNYSSLKATINANVKANGNQEITGPVMNSVLNAMVDSLGTGYQYKGKAVPSTNPGTPDSKVYYLASEPGTYTNFNGIVVSEGEVAILKWDTAWSKEVTGAATAAQLTQLGRKVDEFAQGKFYGYFSNAEELPTGETETGFAYVGSAAPFAVYNYNGAEWVDSGVTIDRIPTGNGEDIDYNADGLLQFADRNYDEQNPDGMGYVILRKNKTFTEQVTETNTIYEIRYPFDLGGASVTIPAGCALKFEGGVLSNGTLTGNNTEIIAHAKIFTPDVALIGFKAVDAKWLGIVPGVDCSEELAWFSAFGLSVHFGAGDYIFNLAELQLARNTEFIGEGSKFVTFRITPSNNYEYLLGLSYRCSIQGIKIVYGNVQGISYGDIIRISNKFATEEDIEGSAGSTYHYNLRDIEIEGTFKDNGDYSSGITGIKIETNEQGNTTNAFALSWLQKCEDISVRFAKVGIHLQTISTTANKYWQNTLCFNHLVLNAKYGIWFERSGGWSHGHCMVSNYLFQATETTESYGLYGNFAQDMVSNYYSWDNAYLGCGNGELFLDATAMAKQITAGTLPSGYTESNGFLVPTGRTLRINAPASVNDFAITPKTYDPTVGGSQRFEFSDFGKIVYTPNTNSPTVKTIETLLSTKSEKEYIIYANKPCLTERKVLDTAKAGIESFTLDQSTGKSYRLQSLFAPTLLQYGTSVFYDNCNGATYFHYAPPGSITTYNNAVYKITATLSSSESAFSSHNLICKGAACDRGSIEKVVVSGKSIDFFIKVVSPESMQYGMRIAFSLILVNIAGNNTATDIKISSTTMSMSALSIVSDTIIHGTTRPTNVYRGYMFFDASLSPARPIWWTGSQWVDATGTAV